MPKKHKQKRSKGHGKQESGPHEQEDESQIPTTSKTKKRGPSTPEPQEARETSRIFYDGSDSSSSSEPLPAPREDPSSRLQLPPELAATSKDDYLRMATMQQMISSNIEKIGMGGIDAKALGLGRRSKFVRSSKVPAGARPSTSGATSSGTTSSVATSSGASTSRATAGSPASEDEEVHKDTPAEQILKYYKSLRNEQGYNKQQAIAELSERLDIRVKILRATINRELKLEAERERDVQ